MDPKTLIRDASRVHANLQEMADGSIITKKGCRIYIPGRFVEKGLAIIGAEVHILGIFAITVEDKYYGVSSATAMMRIEPSSTATILVDDEEYVEFTFDPGSTVIASTDLVKNNALLYEINEEIISKGRVPWYLTYDDLGSLYSSAEHHAGTRLGANDAILEMIAATVARDPDDLTRYYRQSVKTPEDLKTKKPVYVPFRNIAFGASNTTAKLMGAYFEDGLTSALVNPAEKLEDIEELLRR